MMTGRSLLAFCAATLCMSAAPAGAGMVVLNNPSFEAGLTAWSCSTTATGNVTVVHSWTQGDGGSGPLSWGPTQGSWFALLSGGNRDTDITLSQRFTAHAGDVLRFAYFWDGGDSVDGVKYNDSAAGIALFDPAGSATAYPIFDESIRKRGDYNGTPWQYVSFEIPVSGTYDLMFELRNATDSRSDSYLGVDAVPEPAAVLLGLLGLSIAGLKLREYTQNGPNGAGQNAAFWA